LGAAACRMKAGACDDQHGVGQRSTHEIKVRRVGWRGTRGDRTGTPLGSVGDWLLGPDDGPISVCVDIYIYIYGLIPTHEIKKA
jgi:hypothetical protein